MKTAQMKWQVAKRTIFALAKTWVVTANIPLVDLDVANARARKLAA